MIRQLIPSSVCLNCRGCCRFREENSVWLPCLTDEEALGFADRPGIPAVSVSPDKRIQPVPHPDGEGFICAFLDFKQNSCRIYPLRPFECRLYPFLINLRAKKVLLTVDLNCPYVREHLQEAAFKEYTAELAAYLNQPAQLKMLRNNPQLIQAYEQVAEIVELKLPPH